MRRESKSADLTGLAVRRWNEAEAKQVLAAWRESGLALRAFARLHGLQAQRLFFWKKRLDGQPEPMRLLPATVALCAPPQVSLRLPEGVVVELSDAAAVKPEWLVALTRGLLR